MKPLLLYSYQLGSIYGQGMELDLIGSYCHITLLQSHKLILLAIAQGPRHILFQENSMELRTSEWRKD